jgi:hypothetical protein
MVAVKSLHIFNFERVQVQIIQSQEGNGILDNDISYTKPQMPKGIDLTLTSKPKAYAFTKSAPFCRDPISFVCLEVFGIQQLKCQ